MSRELNFTGFSGSGEASASSHKPISTGPSSSAQRTSTTLELDLTDLQILSAQIHGLKKELSIHRGQIDRLESRLREVEESQETKLTRFKAVLKNFEVYIKTHFQKLNTRLAELTSQQMGTKLNEEKIEEMIYHHHQLVQGFNLKLEQMKKIISEQEMQLLNSRAALKDTRQEIERMKRL